MVNHELTLVGITRNSVQNRVLQPSSIFEPYLKFFNKVKSEILKGGDE